LKKVEEIIASLAPKKYAIFVSGDHGVVSMQEDMKRLRLQAFREGKIEQKTYENPSGVYIRFSINSVIHSGIIQTEDEIETRGMLLDLPPRLREENVNLLTIQKIPLDRIPTFPFFTILDKSETKESKRKLSQQYWASFSDNVEALKNWYLDFYGFRRDIVNTEVPQLATAIPSWMSSLKTYVLYNEENRTIATRYYRSMDDKDVVWVKKTSESVGLNSEKVFSSAFDLPPKEDAISETVQFDKEGEKAYSRWDHPYFAAVEDIKKQIEKFNRAQPGILYDAYYASNSLIHHWTYKEMNKVREIAPKFPLLKQVFQPWLEPIQVLVLYFIDEPVKGRITDGIITAYYVNGPEDKIMVKKVENKDDTKWKEDLVLQHFPKSIGKPFLGFTSSMLHYLSNKLGADY